MNEHEFFFAGGAEFAAAVEAELSGGMETELFSGEDPAVGGVVASGVLVSAGGGGAGTTG